VTVNAKSVAIVPLPGVTPPRSIEIRPHEVAAASGANVNAPMSSQPAIARAPTSNDRDLMSRVAKSYHRRMGR